jgi:hypothetical protein
MKKTLQIDGNKARKLYATATTEFKEMLNDTFGSEYFNQPITERVKSFEDACDVLGISSVLPDVSTMPEWNRKRAIADYKRVVITRALNEDWQPDYSNRDDRKFYPWFIYNSASGGFSLDGVGCDYADTIVGARLVFKTEALARYFGNNFQQLHNDYLA